MAEAAHKKGRALEKAVMFIQHIILKSEPSLAGVKFKIETNSIRIVKGVRHELDVVVRINPDTPYEALWIFECKNWKKTVGKNEVIVLTEKVSAVAANRGVIVARKWSPSAEAQAKLDSRIMLSRCDADFEIPFDPSQMVLNQKTLERTEVLVKVVPDGWQKMSMDDGWIYNGQSLILRDLLLREAIASVDKKIKSEQTRFNLEGVHTDKVVTEVSFEPGQLRHPPYEILRMRLTTKFSVLSYKPILESHFAFPGQGLVFNFAPFHDERTGHRFETQMAITFDDKPPKAKQNTPGLDS